MSVRNQVVQIVRTMPGQDCERLEKVVLASLPAAKSAFTPVPLVEAICEIKGELPNATGRAAQREAVKKNRNAQAKYRNTTWARKH